MFTLVLLATVLAWNVKLAWVAPPMTVTLVGREIKLLLELERPTLTPEDGAGPLSVTVPVADVPPVTVDGAEMPLRLGPVDAGVNCKPAFSVTVLYLADMVTLVFVVTALVWTLNAAWVVPAGIVTDVGTVARDILPLLSEMTAPPDGAGPDSVTVPATEVPPTADEGSWIEARLATVPLGDKEIV